MRRSVISPRIPPTGLLALVCFFAVTSIAHACLWDWDTLQMERRRFPAVLEMITGKFVRHSPAYYEWRIQDRTKRMRSPARDPELVDDLAVAYSKLGRHAEGIAILEQALAAHPDRYETLSNLGTIHMLAGDLKTGKEYIDRAIVINPDAHFGREKYQSLLAEYFLTSRKMLDAEDMSGAIYHHGAPKGFAGFVIARRSKDPLTADETKQELAAAQKGVLGMMHFADYESPMLLEALGDLLIAWPATEQDAKQLAARAYLRASQRTDDDAIKDQYKRIAEIVVGPSWDYRNAKGETDEKTGKHSPSRLEQLGAELDRELTDGRKFVDMIAADEQRWISQGANVDQEFAAKYYESLDSTIQSAKKQLSREWPNTRGNVYETVLLRAGLILGAMVIAVVCAIVVFLRRKRRGSAEQ